MHIISTVGKVIPLGDDHLKFSKQEVLGTKENLDKWFDTIDNLNENDVYIFDGVSLEGNISIVGDYISEYSK